MADGEARIRLRFDDSEVEKGLDGVKQMTDDLAERFRELSDETDIFPEDADSMEKQLFKAEKELAKYEAQLERIRQKKAEVEAVLETKLSQTGDNDAAAGRALDQYDVQMAKLNVQEDAINAKIEEQKQKIEATREAQQRLTEEVERQTQAQTANGNAGAAAAKKTSTSMAHTLKTIKRLGLGLIGIRSSFMLLRRIVSTYMSANQELTSTLNGVWSSLGQMLGPAIEWIIGLLAKAVGYVNAFVNALTGINFIAKANTAALKAQGGAAKQLSQAGFDEQNKLSDSGGGGSSTSPNFGFGDVDLSGIQPLLDAAERFKEAVTPLLETLQDAGKWVLDNVLIPVGDWLANSVLVEVLNLISAALEVLNETLIALQPVWEWLWEHVLKPIAEWTGGVIVDVLNSISEWISEHSETLGKIAAVVLVVVGAFVAWNAIMVVIPAVLGAIAAAITSPITWIVALIAVIITLYDECEGFRKGVQEAWDGIVKIFEGAIKFVKGIFEDNNEMVDEAIEDMKEGGKHLIEGLWSGIQAAWEWVKEKVAGVWETLVEKFKNFFGIHSPSTLFAQFGKYMLEGLINGIKEMTSKVVSAAQSIWTAIKNVFSSVGSWFKNTFADAWANVKNVFTTGGQIFSGITQAISDVFKTIVNGLIDGLNNVISKPFNRINTILNYIRSLEVLNVKPFAGWWGYNPLPVPQIPKLARGGIVNNPGRGVLATIGEAGAEAVLPLENNTEWMDELAAKINGGAGGNVTIPIYLNGRRIAEYMVDIQKKRAFALNGG